MARRRPPSLGSGTWAAYAATGHEAPLAVASTAELRDALRLARLDVLQLKREITMLSEAPCAECGRAAHQT